MEKKNSSTTSFRIPVELRQKFKVECAKHGTDQSAVVVRLISDWLREPSGTVRDKRAEKWHALLDEVLASGQADAISAVTENLKVFSRYVRYFQRFEK